VVPAHPVGHQVIDAGIDIAQVGDFGDQLEGALLPDEVRGDPVLDVDGHQGVPRTGRVLEVSAAVIAVLPPKGRAPEARELGAGRVGDGRGLRVRGGLAGPDVAEEDVLVLGDGGPHGPGQHLLLQELLAGRVPLQSAESVKGHEADVDPVVAVPAAGRSPVGVNVAVHDRQPLVYMSLVVSVQHVVDRLVTGDPIGDENGAL